MHLHWNAPHKCGGKQSGDVNWLIIAKPHLLSTQEVQPHLQGVLQCGVLHYDTCFWSHCKLRLHGTDFGSLMNPKESLHREAHLDKASEHKSPWQQRRLCKCMTLSPRVLNTSALYYKSKKLQHAQLQESSMEKI